MKYIIMSANKELAIVEDQTLEIIDSNLLPLFLKRTRNFEQWVSERAIDATRVNSRILKKIHGLSRMASDFDTAMLYNAACITDNFWVRKNDETWEDIRFVNDLYFKAAISSDADAFEYPSSRSPELTNIGSREKGWKLIDGEWWLYKNEPKERAFFELLTSKIGRILGFDMAYYEMDGDFIRTKDVTCGQYNLQPMDALVYDHDGIVDENMEYNYETLYAIRPELAKKYMNIKYMDVLVNNVDRHTKNYAVLTSQETGEIAKLAPNYDNDQAFYGYPDILLKDRMHGEMKEFVALAEKVNYVPPKIDESELVRAISDCNLEAEIKDYILAGEKLVIG